MHAIGVPYNIIVKYSEVILFVCDVLCTMHCLLVLSLMILIPEIVIPASLVIPVIWKKEFAHNVLLFCGQLAAH